MGDDYSIVDDDEFEVFDVMQSRAGLPKFGIGTASGHVVYIDRKRYDRELLVGQEHPVAALNQFAKDAPRSAIYMNGRRMFQPDAKLTITMMRYCTQAVMALPLEILNNCGALVCEHEEKRKMQVFATETNVHVVKEMQLMTPDTTRTVNIAVYAALFDPIAVINFQIGSPTTPSSLMRDVMLLPHYVSAA